MKSNYRNIGDFIKLVDERNKGLKVTNLVGLSISKQFIKSVANIIGTDMENYKIIRKNQFACSTMQVRRDKKMPLALYNDSEPAIISQAYPVFEINDTSQLLPEYLMMWFTRSEFDREACFHAVGGVRGSLEWEDFCGMQLPIPSIEKQQEIVKEYYVIQNRILLNNQLIFKLEETAQAIYKQWFVDFEFPDEKIITIGDLLIPKKGKNITRSEAINGKYPVVAGGIEPSCYHDSFNTKFPVVTISASGANAGYVNLFFSNVWAADCTYIDVSIFHEVYFAYTVLKVNQSLLMSKQIGTGQPHIYPEHIVTIGINNYSKEKMIEFNKIATPIFEKINLSQKENVILFNLNDLVLSKMATIKN
jgi:restriction endonuclease S subunit